MPRTLLTGAAIGLVAVLGFGAPAQAAPAPAPKAAVGLFQGIPKRPVDVYIGKKKVADDFQPGTFVGGLMVNPGSRLVRVTAARASGPKNPLIKARFTFGAGKSVSVIAHLTPKNKRTLTKYNNTVTALPPGKGRVTVRHVAAAPPVDIEVDDAVAIEGLQNPRQAKAVLPVATYEVGVTLSGNPGSLVLGPTDLEVAPNLNTIVYAWGSAKQGNLALAVRTVPLKPYQG